jgi:hypothetical protein
VATSNPADRRTRHDGIRPLAAPGLLPDAIHRPAERGTVLLRLQTTPSREGNRDGAWWPRSRDIGAELPDLIHVLTEHLGPITRVGLDATAWDHTVLITRRDQDHFSLLVMVGCVRGGSPSNVE